MTEPVTLSFVCLGNICRSPIAHVVAEDRIADSGLPFDVRVTSAGTGNWHTGEPMDPRAADVLRRHGYDPSRHRARHFTRDWFAEHDLIFTMDASNHADVVDLAPTVADHARVHMFRSFDPDAESDLDLPDPWFGGPEGFEDTLTIVERTVEAIVDRLPGLTDGHTV